MPKYVLDFRYSSCKNLLDEKIRKKVKHSVTKKAASIFARVEELLLEDLCDSGKEAEARRLLTALRNYGYSFMSEGLDEPDCLLCLFESLHSAALLSEELGAQDIAPRTGHLD
jgi:hypothetical protein